MNEEEKAVLNCIRSIEGYLLRNAHDFDSNKRISEYIRELKTLHSISIGQRIIKESKNG